MLDLFEAGLEIIKRVIPDKEKQQEAELKWYEMRDTGEIEKIKQQAGVVIAEAQGESWLQRNWRPITMLTFVGLVVLKWLGFTDHTVTEAVELQLMRLIEIGIGGYVVGRSIEKAVKSWREK